MTRTEPSMRVEAPRDLDAGSEQAPESRIERTRALLERGFPHALTIDPDDLEALRKFERAGLHPVAAVFLGVLLGLGIYLTALAVFLSTATRVF